MSAKKTRVAPKSRRMVKAMAKLMLSRMSYRPSRAYRLGVQTMLLRRIGGYLVANPYRIGSAEYDAFRAGHRRALLIEWDSLVRQANHCKLGETHGA